MSIGKTPVANPAVTDDETLGVPPGTVKLAATLLAAAGGPFDDPKDGPNDETANDAALAAEACNLLNAPLRLEPDWPDPWTPTSVCDGWVHAELIDDDRALFETLRSRSTGPEDLATTAQAVRLPVNPYRRLPSKKQELQPANGCAASTSPATPADLPDNAAGRTVIDLTTHWAGPLTTKLLATAGATVIKIDPECRPDGFRARPNLYRYLNESKEILDLDLRDRADRLRFEQLVSGADLVIESFSDRVMGNLGYSPDALTAFNPAVSVLSIRAFSASGPDAGRLAYGPGVHAASGLGMTTGTPAPAAVAYPDPLTALVAYRIALEVLGRDDDATKPSRRQVSLEESVEQLVQEAVCDRSDG